MSEFESESLVFLPERLETSDTNVSMILIGQSNRALQVAFASGAQLALQSNTAGVVVTQVNV